MKKNYHAFTGYTISYPEYISVNQEDNGKVSITVRSDGTPICSSISITQSHALKLAQDIIEGIKENRIDPSICRHGNTFVKCKEPECRKELLDAEANAYCPHGFLAGCPTCAKI